MRTDNNDTAVTPVTIYRKDYIAPGYWVDTVEMGFDLDPDATHVATRMVMRRNHDSSEKDIVLFGESLKLLQLRMNGVNLKKSAYKIEGETLRIANAPDEVTLEIETLIKPVKNTSLSGLYTSNQNFITQCEAEGFRKITWFPDRPDVMAKYTVMLRADKKKFPVLLSNGNLIEEGDLGDGRHYAKWEDPFKKPSYLFALVAGKLVCQEEKYKLKSGRKVLLQVWVENGNLDKTQHAMDSLKNSIRWDEERFGLELDLDRFMIVATGDFNMGAMENKGLNIFNTKYVLANPRVATDVDYAGIESVVGHEYFHNWTGNRVTCRDWFQLSLKEGLTVFRDQEFSADLVGTATGRAVKRIEDVRLLRQVQFSEDAGPMAHPVRPDSFVEINNFYTVTIYEKGSEVVRMYYTLLGHEGFRKGMDLYFQRHDGQAVECDDFRAAMADSSGRNLKQFERWYSQSGTPRVKVVTSFDADTKTYEIKLSQSCPATPGQPKKQAFHIPVAVGLLDAAGKDLPLNVEGQPATDKTTLVLELTQASQSFKFTGIAQEPTPSILRNFSAPVMLEIDYTDEQLGHLLAHDSDPFNRWEAGQRLAIRRLVKLTNAVQNAEVLELDSMFIEALRSTLNDKTLDPAFRELVLTLPSEAMIAEEFKVVDPQAIHIARKFVRSTLTQHLKADLLTTYEENLTPGKYSPDAVSAAKRALKNLALSYLLEWADDSTFDLAKTQFDEAENMTDRIAALTALTNFSGSAKNTKAAAQALNKFFRDFKKEALVIDKWFMLQGTARTTDVAKVRELMKYPAFTLSNPNRARSLVFSFCNANPSRFHAADGSGYALWAELVITLNKMNPQVAARLARSMDRWKKYPKNLQVHMKAALQSVADTKKLSSDVLEVVTKALAS
ncbi:aminopeptidase N [Undibacterium sp. RTI2.1]|uniref:aminopeptidase N n=1 Tax=unclassified Undibacterium TaxID=2630295 RepID=UPI002AB32C34|nr:MULTISPECIES: aminopeptidase N [unclassified Undibacterium]MDY7536764.1 aminopeptidase N [Undibacterium sp. 5I1]MEB0029570.1 aminopeptidase N [Undibacterium sp. RTI2.1]MEB0115757.1 aminopeptidase N [Undibacterium sp. RTI2.2]MEB0232938.1 aminopeptidase N [Undibacterium sp. 10I3]MEB0256646.1 aminopeptidase N [Undibacterium sp. 5I1]